MATKKKWFKSAFEGAKSPAADAQKRPKMSSVFLNDDDSIDFNDFDLSSLDNNNDDERNTASQVRMVHTDFKSSNWIEHFAPRNKSDLAVHPKKVAEIEDWFRAVKERKIKSAAPMLLVTGPSGSAKSATIKMIAADFGYAISEWITPVDIEHKRNTRNDSDETTYSESQTDKIAQFLFQSSRYRSVFDTSSKRLVLVEDFPYVFIKDPNSFEEVLERYEIYGKSPLIFIVTDAKSRSLNISFNLFTDEVRNRFNIASISFNPVADTLMKKGLKRICEIMSQPGFDVYYTEPKKDTIESIVLTSQGDIRSAVINLHFASQNNSVEMPTILETKSMSSRSKKSRTTKKSKLKSVGTDENISVLHALGRVLNPKYREEVDANGNKTFTHPPDEISSLLASQPSTSLNLIHHNYTSHFQRMEEITLAIDCISLSDVLLNEWRSDNSADVGVNLAVRGVMTANEHPVSGRWMPIRSGTKNLQKLTLNYEKERKEFQTTASPNCFACDYRTYIKIIPKPVEIEEDNELHNVE